jgi:sugar phosphate isomerase/epimerase
MENKPMTQIAAYLNKEFLDTGDAFGTAKSLGFDAVEIPEMFFSPPEDEVGQEQLAQTIKKYDLKVRWHTSPSYNQYFSSADADLRSKNIERMLWELSLAHKMGWNVFLIHPGHAGAEEDKQRVYEALRFINEKAIALNIQLLLENASGPFDGDPHQLVRTIEEVPGLKLTFDCSHAYRSIFCREGKGTLIDHLSIVKPFVYSFQFNDYDGKTNCEVGKGMLPWRQFMPMALDIGCETWAIELNTIQETVASRDFLQRWLEKDGKRANA